MKKLIDMTNAPSLMEERASRFMKEENRERALAILPKSQEETLAEIKVLNRQLSTLSSHLREVREVIKKQERRFLTLSNYKYVLERTLISPTLVTLATSKKKRKREKLLEKLEALSPSQLKKLEDIKL